MFEPRPLTDRLEALQAAVLAILQDECAQSRAQDTERAAAYPRWLPFPDDWPSEPTRRLADIKQKLAARLRGVEDFDNLPLFDSELRDTLQELLGFMVSGKLCAELAVNEHEDGVPPKHKPFAGASAEFLRSLGWSEENLAFASSLVNTEVDQLKALHSEFGDLGGNVTPYGHSVRTPYAGPPPAYWSTRASYEAWVSNIGAEQAKARLEQMEAAQRAQDEGEEY